MKCSVFRSSLKDYTYIYLRDGHKFEDLPISLIKVFGEPEFVIALDLTPERKLSYEDVNQVMKSLEEKFKPVEEEITPKSIAYRGSLEVLLRGGSLSQQVMMLAYSIGGYPGAPTETDKSQLKELTEKVESLVSKFNGFITADIPGLNDLLKEHELKTLKVPKAVQL